MQVSELWVGLSQDKAALIFTFSWIAWGMVMLFAIMRNLWGDRLRFLEYLILTIGGWVLPVFLLSLLLLTLGIVPGFHFPRLALLGLMILSAGFAIWRIGRTKHTSAFNFSLSLLVAVIWLVLIGLRLPFLTKTSLPLYFDSAEHYRIANVLITDYENAGLAGFVRPVFSYYHLGFHIIVALLTATSQLKLERMMLVFGQIILAFAPIPLFFIVWRETRAYLAGLFAVILGTFGWYMPAHAVNWGKYPALLSLVAALFSLNILYLFFEVRERPLKYRGFVGLISLSILTSFLVHTRSIILIGMGMLSWVLAQRLEMQSKTIRLLFLGLVLVGLAGEIVYIESNRVINALLDPYLHDGLWITCTISLLAIFAYSKHRRFIFACLVFIQLMILSLFIPVSNNTFFTLMDRPFVEMSLFIPLSIMGSLGFARVIDLPLFQSRSLKTAIAVSLLGLIVFHGLVKYDFYPSQCCKIVNSDDLIALQWIDENLPAHALILVPSSEIMITPFGESPQNAGSDAGVWIAPLTGRTTISLPFKLDFSQANTLQDICDRKITYIYVGSTDEGFSAELLGQRPDWYETILFLPEARVYRVLGCA